MKRTVLIIVAVIVLALAGVVVWYQGSLGATGSAETAVVISEGQSTGQIAKTLKSKGLIKSDLAFELHAKLSKLEGTFKSGRYLLSGQKTTPQLAGILSRGDQSASQFTIKEGWTQGEIADLLAKAEVVDKETFTKLKASEFPQYDFLKGLPDDARLEGFLFPETYGLPLPGTPTNQVAEIMLRQFDKELTSELRTKIRRSGRSIFETVIIASIVEKEVRTDQDRKLVAGIMYRRLSEDIRLDADATLRYGLNKPTGEITKADLNSDHPYNTRKLKGLPPGPICNPGLAALKAAIEPEESDYLFYLSAKDGKTIFAKTLEEHEANVEKYLR